MEITKKSELLNHDLTNMVQTNIEGQLSFKNMNKIEWNNLSPESKSEFFMRNVFHDGVDPRIKDQINGEIDKHVETAKQDLLSKIDNEVRNKAMSEVIKQLVSEIHFNEI